MAYALNQSKLDFLRIANPNLRRVFAQGIACFHYQDLPATAVAIHATVQEGAALAFPGPFTHPVIPRSVSVAFAAGWQGGDVTVVGTDQFGRAQSETIADNAGNTVEGVKIFRTITSASKELIAGTTDTCTLQTGLKIGIPVPLLGAWGIQMVDGVAAQPTAWDATYHSFTSATAPNGAHDYTIFVPVDWDAYYKMVSSEQRDLAPSVSPSVSPSASPSA